MQSDVSDSREPKADDLNDLHSAFMRSVQHELRTPLTVIQGYAELLHGGDLGILAPEQKEALFVIVNRVQELRTLVDQINTLLAVESHATASLPLRLDELVVQAVDKTQAAATEAGLTLERHLEPHAPMVLGDPHQIQQAIDCLVENALKFTPSGGRIEVRMWAEPHWVCVEVSDTGIGMTEEELERTLMIPFYQVERTLNRRYTGLGLGLTLARAVVEEHGGKFQAESQPGQGSRFILKLPVPGSTAEEPTVAEAVAVRRVLVVDDEEFVALTLQEALEKLPNCEISVATSGEEALELFEQQAFHLLITDYRMPGTDGLKLAKRVQQLYPGTVIIMITAYGDHKLREQAAQAFIRRILDKPVSLEEIRQVTLEAFDQAEGE